MQVYHQVFNEASKTNSPLMATKIAIAAVKKSENTWIAKSCSVNPKVYNAKSESVDGKAFIGEFIFSDTLEDSDGDEVSVNTLNTKLDGMDGDIEHANLFDKEDFPHDKLFKVLDSMFDGNNHLGKVLFYKNHPMFKQVWDACLKGDFGISPEYDSQLNKIVGITGTLRPKNKRAKIINAYMAG